MPTDVSLEVQIAAESFYTKRVRLTLEPSLMATAYVIKNNGVRVEVAKCLSLTLERVVFQLMQYLDGQANGPKKGWVTSLEYALFRSYLFSEIKSGTSYSTIPKDVFDINKDGKLSADDAVSLEIAFQYFTHQSSNVRDYAGEPSYSLSPYTDLSATSRLIPVKEDNCYQSFETPQLPDPNMRFRLEPGFSVVRLNVYDSISPSFTSIGARCERRSFEQWILETRRLADSNRDGFLSSEEERTALLTTDWNRDGKVSAFDINLSTAIEAYHQENLGWPVFSADGNLLKWTIEP